MVRFLSVLTTAAFLATVWGHGQAAEKTPAATTPSANEQPAAEPLAWHDDYSDAMKAAREQKRMLLILFYQPGKDGKDAVRDSFEKKVLSDSKIAKQLSRYVLVKTPVNHVIPATDDEPAAKLMDHDAFSAMDKKPGLCVIDMEHKDETYYGRVVSAFPFPDGRFYPAPVVSTILGLPRGTLTQRTLVFAVRMHPENPRSTNGSFHGGLAGLAEGHSIYQASITVQGHQNFGSRANTASALTGGYSAKEVCAESWPGQPLVAAALECVHSWRQSSGHWSAVSGNQTYYAYDMKLGRNGVWYATGLFAD